jgi:hypothetical protein
MASEAGTPSEDQSFRGEPALPPQRREASGEQAASLRQTAPRPSLYEILEIAGPPV